MPSLMPLSKLCWLTPSIWHAAAGPMRLSTGCFMCLLLSVASPQLLNTAKAEMERALSRGKLSNDSHLEPLSDGILPSVSLRFLWTILWMTSNTVVTWDFAAESWAVQRR